MPSSSMNGKTQAADEIHILDGLTPYRRNKADWVPLPGLPSSATLSGNFKESHQGHYWPGSPQ
ncbi:MAG: hypothetical protein JKY95_05525 [Planctomycetaceae bacterium]|nr:hypothetical protein [Planctomycetaceae bacterium]